MKILFKLGYKHLAILIALYVFSSLFIFNFSKAALLSDVEYYKGKTPAWGPRPYLFACKPSMYNFFYDGDEYVFFIYKPICKLWFKYNANYYDANEIKDLRRN